MPVAGGIGISIFAQVLLKPDYTDKMAKFKEEVESWPEMISKVGAELIITPISTLFFAGLIAYFM